MSCLRGELLSLVRGGVRAPSLLCSLPSCSVRHVNTLLLSPSLAEPQFRHKHDQQTNLERRASMNTESDPHALLQDLQQLSEAGRDRMLKLLPREAITEAFKVALRSNGSSHEGTRRATCE